LDNGSFKGLIIADRLKGVNNSVYGAIVTLTELSCQIENSNGTVYYSPEAISNALANVDASVVPLSWREVH